jgi:hypothetical protein
MSTADRDEGQCDKGFIESDTAFGMFSGETGGSGWMLRARRGETGPIDEDERPFPLNALIALVILLAMGISVLRRLFRRR